MKGCIAWKVFIFLIVNIFIAGFIHQVGASPDQTMKQPTIASSGNPKNVTAFVNVNLIPMDREIVVSGQTVVVKDDRIIMVGSSDKVTVPDDATIIDGSGYYLFPGLTDAHMHLDSLMNARENFGDAPFYLYHGITTVFNLRGEPRHLVWKRLIQDGQLMAPFLYTAGEFVNEPRVNTPEEVKQEIYAQKEDGYDFIKTHQIVDDETGQFLTTKGLSQPAYESMVETARQADIPLIGHGPYNLGLKAAFKAHQSLAHIGEFGPLYFLPAKRMNTFILLTGLSFLMLLIILMVWYAVRIIRRLFGKSRVNESQGLSTIRVLIVILLSLVILTFICWIILMPGGFFFGNILLLSMISILVVITIFIALIITIRVTRLWKIDEISLLIKGTAIILSLLSLMLAFSAIYWIPIVWRATDYNINRIARKCKKAGIWVQTTLVVYETGFGMRDGYQYQQIFDNHLFKFLPPIIQEEWQEGALMPHWLGALLKRYPEFTRKITAALHHEGVPMMAGTDAMGIPLIYPGYSLHQELRLLTECGLTPYEALWTATVGPSVFLQKQHEFGSIAVGKRADLLLLEKNPFHNMISLEKPIGVMVRGKWLSRNQLSQMLESLS